MPSFVTPARLTAAIGVLTGLGAAVTAALGVVPQDGQVYLVGQEVAGLLTTGVSVFKFLEGQAGWEQLQSAQEHEVALTEQRHQHDLNYAKAVQTTPAPDQAAEPLSLGDEVPIGDGDPEGVVVAEAADDGEPQRLHDQLGDA